MNDSGETGRNGGSPYPSAGLDRLQVGHLRHFANLSGQPPNQWDLMKGKGYGQEDFGGYRFQLAYMAYALALTHRHRLPAAPGVFKPIFERLIGKMLLPEVWMYWRDVSRGGSIFNAHLGSRYVEEWDPIIRDNIMYSVVTKIAKAMEADRRCAQAQRRHPGYRTWPRSVDFGGPSGSAPFGHDRANASSPRS